MLSGNADYAAWVRDESQVFTRFVEHERRDRNRHVLQLDSIVGRIRREQPSARGNEDHDRLRAARRRRAGDQRDRAVQQLRLGVVTALGVLLCLVAGCSGDDDSGAPVARSDRPCPPRARLLRFRCAHHFGYGVSPEMAARCLERCDQDGITGEVEILHALSDTYPVGTQGPVWLIGGRSV